MEREDREFRFGSAATPLKTMERWWHEGTTIWDVVMREWLWLGSRIVVLTTVGSEWTILSGFADVVPSNKTQDHNWEKNVNDKNGERSCWKENVAVSVVLCRSSSGFDASVLSPTRISKVKRRSCFNRTATSLHVFHVSLLPVAVSLISDFHVISDLADWSWSWAYLLGSVCGLANSDLFAYEPCPV